MIGDFFFKQKLGCKFLNLKNHISPLSENCSHWNSILSEVVIFAPWAATLAFEILGITSLLLPMRVPFPSSENSDTAFHFNQGTWYLPWRRAGGMVMCRPVSQPQNQTQFPVHCPAEGHGYSPLVLLCLQLMLLHFKMVESLPTSRMDKWTSLNKQGTSF